jgi:ATP-dependent Clp protease ATP-binding subunit ClpA
LSSRPQEQARGFAHNYVGTEHELLGLLFDQDQTAASVLNQFRWRYSRSDSGDRGALIETAPSVSATAQAGVNNVR